MNFITHNCDGIIIKQVLEPVEIENCEILAGYISISHMGKWHEKKWMHYRNIKSTQVYWESVSNEIGIPVFKLDILIKEHEELRGVWCHPVLLIEYSKWLVSKQRISASSAERRVRDALWEQIGGEREVWTPVGYIDLLTKRILIEVKNSKNWKAALGQVLVYGQHYPKRKKRIHLFGKLPRLTSLETVRKYCRNLQVEVTWVPES